MTETRRKMLALYLIFAVAAIATAIDLAGLLSHHAGAHVAATVTVGCAGAAGLTASAIGIRLQKRHPDQEAIGRMEREIYERSSGDPR